MFAIFDINFVALRYNVARAVWLKVVFNTSRTNVLIAEIHVFGYGCNL